MEQYALYLVIKDLCKSLTDKFVFSFNDMDFNKENVAGIYIRGSTPSSYRSLMSGSYYNKSCRMQILLQGGLSGNSIIEMLKLSSNIREALVVLSNKRFDIPDNSFAGYIKGGSILITLIKLLGDVSFVGKSEQGLPRYSLNFKIDYTLIGGLSDG